MLLYIATLSVGQNTFFKEHLKIFRGVIKNVWDVFHK